MTSEDTSPHPTSNSEDTITLFAPFEAQKPSRSLFQRSSEYEGDSNGSGVDARSREIVFDASDAQSSGNARVLFRKLKAAVSGSSSSSQATASSSSSVTSSAQFNKPQNAELKFSLKPPTSERSSLRGHRSKVSPTSSVVSVSSATGVEQGGVPGHIVATTMEWSINEEPKISLTSYSDAHSHAVKQPTGVLHTGGGTARPQAQAVNKTEMLKRFGSIADNQVQVSVPSASGSCTVLSAKPRSFVPSKK